MAAVADAARFSPNTMTIIWSALSTRQPLTGLAQCVLATTLDNARVQILGLILVTR